MAKTTFPAESMPLCGKDFETQCGTKIPEKEQNSPGRVQP